MFAIIGVRNGAHYVRSVHWSLRNAIRRAIDDVGAAVILRGETFEAGQRIDVLALRRENVVAVK